jgi:hypothetical protein
MKKSSITLRWVEGYPITHWVVGLLTMNPGIQQFLCRPQKIRDPRRNRK